jgi:TPR repeat protein
MRRFAAGLIAALMLAGSPAGAADDFVEGVRAFQKGDFETAWFRFLGPARKGDVAAQFNLAQLYRQGMGIPADLTIARHWYEAAAAQGHALAQFSLGVMYEKGDGVTADLVEAKAWYERAAKQNLDLARFALERLERGSGAPR